MSSSPSSYTSNHAQVGNRRRNGYELTRQRDMVPIALGAGLAAVVLHVLAWFYLPSFLPEAKDYLLVDGPKVEDEVIRVVAKPVQEEYTEAEPTEPEQQESQPQEIEQLEPAEIDILDAENIEALAIAPGETSIALPEPTMTADAPEAGDAINPEPINMANLASAAPEPALIAPPEPAPVNSNDVIANITAQPDDAAAAEASAIMEESLRREASEGTGSMPGDTRSLAELMGIQKLGASSGVARLGADVLFSFDKVELKNYARITMLRLAVLIIKNSETNFIIEGHTDSFGSEDYNALLSLKRAAAVREWLMNNGVPVNRVYLRACGNHNPLVDPKGSKEAQSLNRRVEIHMRREEEELPAGCVPSSVAVDITTPVVTQIANGVRVPEAYASAYGKNAPAAKAPAKASGKTPAKASAKPSRNGR